MESEHSFLTHRDNSQRLRQLYARPFQTRYLSSAQGKFADVYIFADILPRNHLVMTQFYFLSSCLEEMDQ
jgi:hypothetical protein